MIEATFALNEYLTPYLQQIEPRISFFPGANSHDDRGHNHILYDTVPTEDYDILGLHTDHISYRICHVNYDSAQRLADVVMRQLNIDDPEGIINEPGIRFQFTHADGSGTAGAVFQDNTEFTAVLLNIQIMYTVL